MKITIGTALGYSVLGIAVVFAVLVILMVIISIMSKIFVKIESSKKAAEPAPAAAPAPAEVPLAKGSCGEVCRYDVPDRVAAMLMAIVADELGAPLNELRFISIREVEDESK